ncbi:MAG: glycoside hydrolase family 3 N-terminal domain-containing protein [Anaerolineales bacterium]
MKLPLRMFRLLLTFLTLLGLFLPIPQTLASISPRSAHQKAASLLEELTPQERVGQLFLVTFKGTETGPNTPIYDLTVNHHIGGVILKNSNSNILNGEDVIEETWTLINNIQLNEYTGTQDAQSGTEGVSSPAPAYIPLLIGLSQEGDQSDYSQLLKGLSPIPSQLAIGATWDPSLAEEVGRQVGRELSLLGINLLLGPSLDVLSDPKPGQPSDLGVRSFGGDPYWVGQMGQFYIKGVHDGSQNNIKVVGKFFPGLGSSDRLPKKEIATVRKSLEQLKQIDLAPFFDVTGNASSPVSTIDALLTSHIRYQGLQGNIRSTTRPISLDPQALQLLMNLDPLQQWRQAGGVLISDNLGSQALHQFYDPSGEILNIRRVALDAFMAGNDILYIGDFPEEQSANRFTAIQDTLTFFSKKYQEDQAFANQVDESVLRILTLKFTIYPEFSITHVLRSHGLLSEIGQSADTAAEVARQGATLISPELAELDNVLPNPPQKDEQLVILTDTKPRKLCGSCPEEPSLESTALEEAILRLYGPSSSQQVTTFNITSLTYKELIQFLNGTPETEYVGQYLRQANWIIAATLEASTERPNSLALHRLLAERQDLIREKKLVVFAFNAPYYLDATNISKVTALFGLYSKLPPFIDFSARLLFKEIPSPNGDLPVSVPGIGYDLISATSPDPDQVFQIHLGEKPELSLTPTLTEAGVTPTAPAFDVGDILDIHTGVIVDHNGNPVPDGTPVQFVIISQGETDFLPPVETEGGRASTSYLIDQGDDFSIQAICSPAESMQLSISVRGDSSVVEEGQFTSTPIPSTPSVSPTSENTPAAIITPEPSGQTSVSPWNLWFLSLLETIAIALIAYQTGAMLGFVRWGIRWGFSAFIGGLLVYNYLILGLPGSSWFYLSNQAPMKFGLIVLFGSIVGWAVSFLIHQSKSFKFLP